MHKHIQIKPLSVNLAYKGRKFVTQRHKDYKSIILLSLPTEKLKLTPPFKIRYHFGFSTTNADLDNPVKVLQDIICGKYGFDDRHIWEINVKKHIVPKGKEYVEFEIIEMNRRPPRHPLHPSEENTIFETKVKDSTKAPLP